MKKEEIFKSTLLVKDWLGKHGFKNEIVIVDETARTAQDAADSLKVNLGQIAKSLIFMTKNSKQSVLIITSGSNRVNEKNTSKLVGEEIERAEANWVKLTTGFSIGGIPPVAHKIKPIIFFDEDLDQYDEIWAAAGHPYAVFKTTPRELLEMTEAKKISVK